MTRRLQPIGKLCLLLASTPANYRFRVLPPPVARLELTGGASMDLNLVVQSRVGARLQLLATADFDAWTTNASSVLTNPTWQLVLPAPTTHRFWRVQEVFDETPSAIQIANSFHRSLRE